MRRRPPAQARQIRTGTRGGSVADCGDSDWDAHGLWGLGRRAVRTLLPLVRLPN
jgi:hypothetical protein